MRMQIRVRARTAAFITMTAIGAGFAWGAASVALKLFPYPQLARLLEPARGGSDGWRAARAAKLETFRALGTRAEIAMLGDSLTAAADWRELLPGADVVNRGLDGDRTDDVLARLDTVTAVRPAKVFVMLGTNDLATGRPVDAVLSDYRRIVEALRTAGIDVTIQSTLDCARATCGRRLDAIRELNAGLRGLADETRSTWIDLNPALSTPQAGLRAEHTYDGVHLTAAGYLAWREALRPHAGPR